MSHHVFRLLDRHQKLDEALRCEQKRQHPDFNRLQRLKRLRLAVKDRLRELADGDPLRTSLNADHPTARVGTISATGDACRP